MSYVGYLKAWDGDFWVPFIQDDEWGTLYQNFDGEPFPDNEEYNVPQKISKKPVGIYREEEYANCYDNYGGIHRIQTNKNRSFYRKY